MIAVFLANGFEEVEALSTVDVLRRAELDVRTVGVGGEWITGAHGIAVRADIEERALDVRQLDAVVLPGGMPGTLNLEQSPVVREAVRHCHETGVYLAAICAAPSILGHMGLLQGKRAVCFPGFEKDLLGAQVQQTPVCTDGKIITARGAGVALAFGLEIVAQIAGKKLAEKIRVSMQCA